MILNFEHLSVATAMSFSSKEKMFTAEPDAFSGNFSTNSHDKIVIHWIYSMKTIQ